MIEENAFSLKVRDFCRRELLFCSVDTPVMETAAIMRDKGISSIVVEREGAPVGIITDRDLRNKIVATGAAPSSLRAGAIMNAPLITVSEDDIFFEVVFRMSRHGIHRLGVVDADNRLCGMVNESDLVRTQSRSPQQLVRALETASGVDDLKRIHEGIIELAVFLNRAGVPPQDLVRLISHLNDQIVQRLIAMLRKEHFPGLTERFAFLVLGSEGRGEQTLKTDQDNAIIHADDLSEEDLARLAAFSEVLIDFLAEIGVPECPGGIMAKNPFWRRSLSGWVEAVDQWMSVPDAENTLNFSMLSDMRMVCGDAGLVRKLQARISARASEEPVFLTRMAAKALHFALPLGFFGGFKVEKGEHAGEIDLKKAGIYAISEGVKVLGLEAGILGGATLDKVKRLRKRGILSHERAEDLEASFTMLCSLRLHGQMKALEASKELSNHITPAELNRIEKGQFHVGLEVVQSFEAFLKDHFRPNMIF